MKSLKFLISLFLILSMESAVNNTLRQPSKINNLSVQAEESSQETVNILDSNLEKVIRQEIGKLTGNITKEDMLKLKTLNGESKAITYLAGLEFAENLTELNLNQNQISDISALANLADLKYVYFIENPINEKTIKVINTLRSKGTHVSFTEDQLLSPDPITDLEFTDIDLEKGQIGGEIKFNPSTSANVTIKVFVDSKEIIRRSNGKYVVDENTKFTDKSRILVKVSDDLNNGLVTESILGIIDIVLQQVPKPATGLTFTDLDPDADQISGPITFNLSDEAIGYKVQVGNQTYNTKTNSFIVVENTPAVAQIKVVVVNNNGDSEAATIDVVDNKSASEEKLNEREETKEKSNEEKKTNEATKKLEEEKKSSGETATKEKLEEEKKPGGETATKEKLEEEKKSSEETAMKEILNDEAGEKESIKDEKLENIHAGDLNGLIGIVFKLNSNGRWFESEEFKITDVRNNEVKVDYFHDYSEMEPKVEVKGTVITFTLYWTVEQLAEMAIINRLSNEDAKIHAIKYLHDNKVHSSFSIDLNKAQVIDGYLEFEGFRTGFNTWTVNRDTGEIMLLGETAPYTIKVISKTPF